MKTEQQVNVELQLNKDILKITLIIKSQYPELSKYMEEMPDTIPNSRTPEITLRNLQSYYDSLQAIVKEYSETHTAKL
jgi:hypothetical protein